VRVPADEDGNRPIRHVPPAERRRALVLATVDARAIDHDQLRQYVARLFGWRRTGAEISGVLDDDIDSLVESGALVKDGTLLRSAGGVDGQVSASPQTDDVRPRPAEPMGAASDAHDAPPSVEAGATVVEPQVLSATGRHRGAEPATSDKIAPGQVLRGSETLEVVGESYYQRALKSITRWKPGDGKITRDIVAVLVPEPDNKHDKNAIAVRIDGKKVGHLSRQNAVRYGPGLRRLMAERGGPIALRGVISGGGRFSGRQGDLGVFLTHNPADFGLR